jgi:poly(hydroxyalkanoate) granule-associated protein
MATKKTTKKKTAKAEPLGESAHRIWLAGLGALASAEEEGGKLFRRLVEKGESFRGPVKEPVKSARGKVRETVDEVRGRARTTVRRLEKGVDDGFGTVLDRLGVPSRDEIADLTARVERLTRAVESMKGGTRKKTAAKKAARKTVKKAAKKKTGARSTAKAGAARKTTKKKTTRKS